VVTQAIRRRLVTTESRSHRDDGCPAFGAHSVQIDARVMRVGVRSRATLHAASSSKDLRDAYCATVCLAAARSLEGIDQQDQAKANLRHGTLSAQKSARRNRRRQPSAN
jgi:hypothetical protein